MHSPRHRANILDAQYNAIGIGVVRTSHEIFVTQDFARRLPDTSVDEAEEQVGLNLNRLRRKAGAPVLNRVPALQLRQQACEMAANNKLNPRAGLSRQVSNSVDLHRARSGADSRVAGAPEIAPGQRLLGRSLLPNQQKLRKSGLLDHRGNLFLILGTFRRSVLPQ